MKEYTFWQEIKKYVREECVIKASPLFLSGITDSWSGI